MYSFEGQFRRKPQQALGGASKKLERTELLNQALVERQQREQKRKRNLAAVCIQSYYRGAKVREKEREKQRITFDCAIKNFSVETLRSNYTEFGILFSQLMQFYNDDNDKQRLTMLTQLCLQTSGILTQLILEDPNYWIYKVQKLCVFNINRLISAAPLTASVAIPLRFFEVFTSPDSYIDRNGGWNSKFINTLEDFDKSVKLLISKLWSAMIACSYFTSMRFLLVHRVPNSLVTSPEPPTPLAASILTLILRPLESECPNKPFIIRTMIIEVFSSSFLPQIYCFLLPALALQSSAISTDVFLYSLLSTEFTIDSASSAWIMYTVVHIISHRLALLNESQLVQYLCVLKSLVTHLPRFPEYDSNGCINSDDDEEDDEMEKRVPTDSENSQEVFNIIRETISIINQAEHINILLRILEDQSVFKESVVPICYLGYFLLGQQRLAVYNYRLLYTLAFKPLFLRRLWSSVVNICASSAFGSSIPLLQCLSQGMSLSASERERLVPQLTLFCALTNHSLSTLHDIEFYGETDESGNVMPFSLQEISSISLVLRDVCMGLIDLAYPDTRANFNEDYIKAMQSVGAQHFQKHISSNDVGMWNMLFKYVILLLRHLYSRDSRQKFCPDGQWIAKRFAIPFSRAAELHFSNRRQYGYEPFIGLHPLTRGQLEEEGPPPSAMEVRQIAVLREFPFVIHFPGRVKIFQSLITKDKEKNQGELVNFRMGPHIHALIRRNFIYEDAFDNMSYENEPNLKLKVLVQLVNAVGLDEVGIDGGGIFREFLNELLKTCFDPNRGFFKTTHDRLLYPNPGVHRVVPNFTKHYYFIGRMLGKAIYENMMVELPFAGFFLAKILAQNSPDVDIHHLASLDPVMYKNLLYLKTYNGDISDLGLDFTVMSSELGENEVIELKPGGSNIPVTESNRITYIHMMADYKLNKQIKSQCQAFKDGLSNVIDLEWLYMFDPNELQVLISGAEIPIDIDDLKSHTNYAGGYSNDHPVIQAFWRVVEDFDEQRRRQLLKFVTSCSRPPLLGFKELSPSFCIQNAGREPDRLPTASTCMNLLKLPEFQDEMTLRTKLLYAVESGAGFELS